MRLIESKELIRKPFYERLSYLSPNLVYSNLFEHYILEQSVIVVT